MQLHQPHALDALARLNAGLLAVSFAPLDRLTEWVPFFQKYFLERYYSGHNLDLPSTVFSRTRFLSDPQLTAYHAYGLGRNSMLKVYGPRIIWQYFRWGLMGKPIKKPLEDTLQRGGDFVGGRDGRLRLCHVGRDQSDRPAVADIISALGG